MEHAVCDSKTLKLNGSMSYPESSLGLKQRAKAVTKQFLKRIISNFHTNNLLALNIPFTSYFRNLPTLLRVIHYPLQIIIHYNTNHYCNNGTIMAPKRSVEPLISLEWAESLVGLALKVPQKCFTGLFCPFSSCNTKFIQCM
jgi:hypothetical protein